MTRSYDQTQCCLLNVHHVAMCICVVIVPYSKAIRDGKYLARHMPVLGNVHPIKIENFDIFRDVISLFARVVILLIDTATQEVPMENI